MREGERIKERKRKIEKERDRMRKSERELEREYLSHESMRIFWSRRVNCSQRINLKISYFSSSFAY